LILDYKKTVSVLLERNKLLEKKLGEAKKDCSEHCRAELDSQTRKFAIKLAEKENKDEAYVQTEYPQKKQKKKGF
jgi:hypothetical protein